MPVSGKVYYKTTSLLKHHESFEKSFEMNKLTLSTGFSETSLIMMIRDNLM